MLLELTCDFGVVVNLLHRDVQWDIFCIELEFKLIVFELEVQDVWHHAIGYGIHAAGVFFGGYRFALGCLGGVNGSNPWKLIIVGATISVYGDDIFGHASSESGFVFTFTYFFVPTCQ